MAETILGTRIRERRRQIGITQADLARRIGISASYLNLIEHNKRQVGGPLLRRAAEALQLGLEELDGAAERRLVEDLVEIAGLPALRGCRIEEGRAGELTGRYPGWSRALAALARSEQEATQRAQALSDRLNHDPFLGETVHRMLSRITAIRSVAEILVDFSDVEPEKRARFHEIVHEESRNLSEVAEALAAYFDRVDDNERTLTPVDEVEALFVARDNRFDEIERATVDLAGEKTAVGPGDDLTAIHALAEDRMGSLIDGIIGSQPEIETAAARARARRALLHIAAASILMPMPAFADRAAETDYDIEALAEAFGCGPDLVCQRLTALPPGEGRPRFGYFRANAAGTIIEMLTLPGLSVPRYAPACPLWILYRAQQAPGIVIRQRVLFPNGNRFVFVARARNTGPIGFAKPRHYVTDMLTMSEEDSHFTTYAPTSETELEEVGPACRLCPRKACAHRVEDPLGE